MKAGYVAIVGRPNVGKSTLLNRLVGQKISITSHRPQTTRHRISGILTTNDAQFVFVDTPGFQTKHASALNRAMNRSVKRSLETVDAVLFVIEASHFDRRDEIVLGLLPEDRPVLLVINKIDRVEDKSLLLPFIEKVSKLFSFSAIVPVSAEKGMQVEELAKAVEPFLPEGEAIFGEDEITERSERFLASELVREKLFRLLGEEIPYSTAVEIESFETEGEMRRIRALILVDKPNQKAIVIGKNGEKLKTIASRARVDMEKLFGGKVFLEVWVKVKSGWGDDERVIKSLGYEEG
ncbi:MAG TPA: GTPase Era [Burkholderiales bacterium]|nr:GTPase Era [Burkholderiales bacterium]